MEWQELRRMRRRTRQALRVRDWPWRRKVAIGAWVPVAAIAFFLFTGPNGSSSGATTDIKPAPKTVVTVKVPPPRLKIDEAAQRLRAFQHTQSDIAKWAGATPIHLTMQQQHDMARWFAAKRRLLIVKHKAAVESSHNPAPQTP